MKDIKINDCCDNIKKAIELLENEKEEIKEEIDFLGIESKESDSLWKDYDKLDKITEKLENMIEE